MNQSRIKDNNTFDDKSIDSLDLFFGLLTLYTKKNDPLIALRNDHIIELKKSYEELTAEIYSGRHEIDYLVPKTIIFPKKQKEHKLQYRMICKWLIPLVEILQSDTIEPNKKKEFIEQFCNNHWTTIAPYCNYRYKNHGAVVNAHYKALKLGVIYTLFSIMHDYINIFKLIKQNRDIPFKNLNLIDLVANFDVYYHQEKPTLEKDNIQVTMKSFFHILYGLTHILYGLTTELINPINNDMNDFIDCSNNKPKVPLIDLDIQIKQGVIVETKKDEESPYNWICLKVGLIINPIKDLYDNISNLICNTIIKLIIGNISRDNDNGYYYSQTFIDNTDYLNYYNKL